MDLVELGALVPVDVRGCARQALSPRRGARAAAGASGADPSVAFIAPFDPLLWDTALLSSLFDFDYVWEGFFPPAKRRWGYYVLPIIFGDRFVGRIEPRIDRDRARVEVLNVWWEDGFAPRRADGFVDAMRDALRAYLRFAGADRLDWAPHLATEKRLFPHPTVTDRRRITIATRGRGRRHPSRARRGPLRDRRGGPRGIRRTPRRGRVVRRDAFGRRNSSFRSWRWSPRTPPV